MESRLFEGIKVADFTHAIAGPTTTEYLAQYGATVVKIESPNRPDPQRTMSPFKDNIAGLNRSGTFALANANKYSITLDLHHPRAKEVMKRIIAWADIVVENFRGGTMKKWGLGYDDLKKIKPNIIMLSSCMQGQTGPYGHHPGYGMPLTALTGFVEITGWPDRAPSGPFASYTDWIVPRLNALMLIAGLLYRSRTGKGQYFDCSQYEAGIHFITPLILDYTVNGRQATRMGNLCSYAAPHGVYPCQGDDRWCAISVLNDEEWQSFCNVVGSAAWTEDPRFTTAMGRIENAEELDKLMGEWTISHSAEEVMNLMQAAGISAGIVATGRDLDADPQLKYYHYFEELEHPEMGKVSYRKLPISLSKVPTELRASPCLGEHNEYFYVELIGMPEEEFIQLLQEGCFG